MACLRSLCSYRGGGTDFADDAVASLIAHPTQIYLLLPDTHTYVYIIACILYLDMILYIIIYFSFTHIRAIN